MKKNCSINIFRYICALMVMAIHIHPFEDINDIAGREFRHVIPRIGVPFFFCVSGYFYIRKLERGDKAFLPYITRLLKVYAVWSCFYYLIDLIEWGKDDLPKFIRYAIRHFLIEGSHYHFWFFTALIFAVTVVSILFSLKLSSLVIPASLLLYAVGCLGFSYYKIGSAIPGLNRLFESENITIIRHFFFMGLPFFCSGYVVSLIERSSWYRKLSSRALFLLFFAAVAYWRIELIAVQNFKLSRSIVFTPGLYLYLVALMLVLLRFPMPQLSAQSDFCKTAAGLTYYIHPFFIWLIHRNAARLPFDPGKTLLYAMVWFITFVLSYLVYRSDNQFLKMISG